MRNWVASITLVVFILAGAVVAQQNARLRGTVTDVTGGVIPGVTVVVTNVGTNISRSYITDDEGRFAFTELQPGPYQITAEMAGFKKFVGEGIILRVADSLEVPVRLEIGEMSQVVTVSGAADLLQTTTSSLGEVVENKLIEDLPMDGRQTLSLVVLVSGVTPNRQMESAAQPFNRAGNFAISGGRGVTNELLLDGTPNTVAEGSTGAFTAVTAFTPADATREFKVETNAFSAEYGRSGGGVVNIVTKSGTNEIHGSVFEFHRNSVFDANNFFDNKNNVDLASFKRNQFGASVGGPVWIPGLYDGKDRTFFFVSWETLMERSAYQVTHTVPTAMQRGGDFSETFSPSGELVRIYDPLTTTYDAAAKMYVREPFEGNRIPTNRLDPVMQKVFAFWPEPTGPGQQHTGANNFYKSMSRPIDDHKLDVRIDHRLTERQQMFGRVSISRRDWNLPNVYGNIADQYARTYPSDPTSIKLGHTYTFSPHYLLDLRYAYNYLYFAQEPESAGYDFRELGLPDSLYGISQYPEFPRFIFSNYGGFGHSSNTMWGRQEAHIFMGSLSRSKGRHILKAGFDTRMSRIGRFVNWGPSGYFAFSPAFTQGPNALQASLSAGNSLASGLLGNAATRVFNMAANPAVQNLYTGFFLQDDVRLTAKLTLNLGLRYDLELPMTERFNNISWADPTAPSPINALVPELDLKGAVFFADANHRKVPFNVDRNNFGPRLGIAYELRNNLVLRTAYGVFYAPQPNGISDNIGYGFSAVTYAPVSYDGVTPVGSMGDPFFEGLIPVLGRNGGPETQIGQGVNFWHLDSRTPYNQQWNLNLQSRFGQNFLVNLAYSGSKGTKLPARIGINQLRAEQLGPEIVQSVANPFQGIITQGTLAGPTVRRSQLMMPFPQYTSAGLQFPTAASSTYHSFQLNLNKRFAGGSTFLTSYTVGKLIDDASGLMDWLEPATGHQDVYNRRQDRAVSDQDLSQRLVTAFSYELPFGHNRALGANWSPVLNHILGGWQINGIMSLQSGVPLGLRTTNTSYSGNAYLRPDMAGSALVKGGTKDERLNNWFDTSVFSQPALFTFGTAGRNLPDVRGPGLKNLDFSLFRNIALGEGRFLQIRGEFFNLTNTPEFNNPTNNLQTASFGRILSQRNRPRQVQLGLRIVF